MKTTAFIYPSLSTHPLFTNLAIFPCFLSFIPLCIFTSFHFIHPFSLSSFCPFSVLTSFFSLHLLHLFSPSFLQPVLFYSLILFPPVFLCFPSLHLFQMQNLSLSLSSSVPLQLPSSHSLPFHVSLSIHPPSLSLRCYILPPPLLSFPTLPSSLVSSISFPQSWLS